MKIKKLELVNLRGFEQATLDFDNQFNLIVGVNGVGKSTVLDVIRLMILRSLPSLGVKGSRSDNFRAEDLRIGAQSLSVTADFQIEDMSYSFSVHRQRSESVPNEEGSPRSGAIETPDHDILSVEVPASKKSPKLLPSSVYFSTRRALIPKLGVSRTIDVSTNASRILNALDKMRELSLRRISDWLSAQEELVGASGQAGQRARNNVEALKAAVTQFLPECDDLTVGGPPKARQMLIRKMGVLLDVRLLSDGERSMLALVLDLAQRIAQFYPQLSNPIKDGQCLVLIDELDMHMHPQWQRQILYLLTRTFPSCQFIATSHSPTIISETSPENVLLLTRENDRIVPKKCGQAFGLDANAILEQVMQTSSRPAVIDEVIAAAEVFLDCGDLEQARVCVNRLRDLQRGDTVESIRLETTIDNLDELSDAEG